MAGLLVTALGWGLYVFGLDRVPVSAARTITGGSYVVLALFSIIFLRTPLRLPEWIAVVLVTSGILLLGLDAPPAAAEAAPSLPKVILGACCVALFSIALFSFGKLKRRPAMSVLTPMVIFAALSGLLSSVGDLMMKTLLSVGLALPWRAAAVVAAMIAFYVVGVYMLSRSYQAGSMVGGVVISDFFARVGAIFLGALALSEPLAGAGVNGVARGAGFLLVLGGSLLLGRFGSVPHVREIA
jgi:drug/metabolite transporter (DMT)-like permease